MRLKSCIEKYKKDTHRAGSPEETLSRIESKMVVAGITRVADITDLDRIGIPVFSSIRPTVEDGAISVYNGKEATPAKVMVSAMMEGIERYSAEVHDRKLVNGRFSELVRDRTVLNPDELILPHSSDPDNSIQWTGGYDLMNDEEILVPASAVFHPLPLQLPPSRDHAALFRTNTNGLASGNELEEAIFHGLSEVIERDACEKILRIAKSLYFPDRTYQRILDAAGGVLDVDALKRFRRFIEVEKRDLKREDAIEALKRIRDIHEVTE